jgi:hypothetical protein
MPPQQDDGLLDLMGEVADLGAHIHSLSLRSEFGARGDSTPGAAEQPAKRSLI